MPNASGRRHKQALNGYKHIAARQRPHYKRKDIAAAQRHLQEVIRREHERDQRKGVANKKAKK